jgi:hypothetical protein
VTKRPSSINSAMFSGLAFGTFFLVTGLIGYNADSGSPLLAASRWTGQPILWQMAVGAALLTVGLFLLRRVTSAQRPRRSVSRPPGMKHVGKGRSRGAQQDGGRALTGHRGPP